LLRLESSFNALVELARHADERADGHQAWINTLGEAQVESERRISALVDAQIRTEEKAQRTDEALRQLADAQRQLADSQRLTDKRLNALIEILTKARGSNGDGSGDAGF
jgi:hypothetical protein